MSRKYDGKYEMMFEKEATADGMFEWREDSEPNKYPFLSVLPITLEPERGVPHHINID